MKNTLSNLLKNELSRAFQLLWTVFLVCVAANLSAAQTYEPFNYTAGAPISGLNGGTGWSGSWMSGSGAITNGGLTYPGLVVAGNALGPSGAFTQRSFASPISTCSVRIAVLINSPSAGTPASQATVGNVGGATNGHFIFGDLPMPDAQANTWGIQNAAGRFYSGIPVVAGQTTYLVAQIDFQSGNDTLRLWVNPSASIDLATGTFPPANVTTTTSNITQFAGLFWQTQQQQSLDEIRVVRLAGCPGATPQDGCCDTMRVTPVVNPPLNQDYRKFEIFNPLPSSPICSIDINMSPLPPTTNWQGGQAFQNTGFGYPSSPVNFTFASIPAAYRRIPTTTAYPNMSAISNPLSSPAVVFNLGFDNTQPYNGATYLTINHCDGRRCILEYRPWIVTPMLASETDSLPWIYNIRELSSELLEVTLTYDVGRNKSALWQDAKSARWLGLNLLTEGMEIYSIDETEAAGGKKESSKFSLSSSSLTPTTALLEFNGLLDPANQEQNGRTITLLLRRKGGTTIDPKDLRLTLFDEHANTIIAGIPQQ